MLTEDALAVFKVLVKHNSPCHDRVVEIAARNSSEASEACGRMFAEEERLLAARESKNVYCSKRVLSFELMDRPWRDVLMCMPKLEDHV